MRVRLCSMFFLSGSAALLFETLWFHQAGLLLGNSVWTSSIVLGSFMAGLAAGNAAAARWGTRLHRPLRRYARLEWTIGASGLVLVLLFPWLTRLFAPGLAHVVSWPWLLDASRLGLAFALMVVPSSAMGATLPVLLSSSGVDRGAFGRDLGLLYGWNTLGAVVGALLGEFALFELLGVRGSGLAAASFNLTAGLIAWRLDRSVVPAPDAPEPPPPPVALRPGARAALLLAATFLAGGAMLALEVVWFRFLLLYAVSTSRTFSVMLAVILAGIALGGLLASRVLRRWPGAAATAPLAALGAGMAVALGYASFWHVLRFTGFLPRGKPSSLAALAAYLILPTALLSGFLFTLLGQSLREHIRGGGARAAGLLTLSNTVGAMLGSFVGAFLLIPGLGMEGSFFVLALVYGLVAACVLPPGAPRRRRLEFLAALAGFAAVLFFFPFGLMRTAYLDQATRRWVHPEATGFRVLAAREGTSETVVYLSSEMWGAPIDDRLLTNGYSMSGRRTVQGRYMRLFAYWPLAVLPKAKRALLISYGVGTTAEALTEAPGLESIDVVDVSRDIFRMGRVFFPDRPYPLDDPRVRTHVEDGRFFLLTTHDRFDIITGEPPPRRTRGSSTSTRGNTSTCCATGWPKGVWPPTGCPCWA